MKKAPLLTAAEITAKALEILRRELGPVNTARFLNQFSHGTGNYTEERAALNGDDDVESLVAEIKANRSKARSRKNGTKN